MKTGLNKRQKTTVIYFDEYGDLIEMQTHNSKNDRKIMEISNINRALYTKSETIF